MTRGLAPFGAFRCRPPMLTAALFQPARQQVLCSSRANRLHVN